MKLFLMQEKHLLLRKVVVDVNIPAIYLVEDHPGHKYVYEYLNKLIENGTIIYAHSVIPYKVLWILTKLWGIDAKEAFEAVRSFVENINIRYVGLSREWLLKSFELALMVKAEAIVTTDTDFKTLAPKIKSEIHKPSTRRRTRGT